VPQRDKLPREEKKAKLLLGKRQPARNINNNNNSKQRTLLSIVRKTFKDSTMKNNMGKVVLFNLFFEI